MKTVPVMNRDVYWIGGGQQVGYKVPIRLMMLKVMMLAHLFIS